MKVLVLGGTGAMGIHLVKMLAERNVDTVVTTRRSIRSHDTVQYIQIDAQNLVLLQPLLDEQWDAIVDFMAYTTDVFRVHLESLLNATFQYIFVSSARVYANSDQPLTESSPRLLDVIDDSIYLETDEYALSKARQEDILITGGYKNWTIVRPYITYSENRLQLGVLEKEEWLYRALKGRSIVFSSDIAAKTTTLTYGFDVGKAIVNLIGCKNANGEIFNITAPHSIGWEKVLNIYLECIEKQTGKRPDVLFLNLKDFSTFHLAVYQIKYDRLYNRTFASDKIYGYLPSSDFHLAEDGIRKCFELFLQNPKFGNINWKKEALKDLRTKEHSSLSDINGIGSKVKYVVIRYFTNFYLLIKHLKS